MLCHSQYPLHLGESNLVSLNIILPSINPYQVGCNPLVLNPTQHHTTWHFWWPQNWPWPWWLAMPPNSTRAVKIFIMASFSNAMNPWEIPLVPSLRRAIVPGPYARSCSVSLDLQWSGQTWIISWPDHAGLQGLTIVQWPQSHVLTTHRPSPAGQQQEPFHLTFRLVWNSSSRTRSRALKSL